MDLFTRLCHHNAWANARVVAAARGASVDVLEALRHLAGTEEAFLLVLRGTPDWPVVPEEFEAATAFLAERDAALAAFAGGIDAVGLQEMRFVPWFEREVTVEDCLTQVLGHSAQHRAEVAWQLAQAGVDTGDLDYIVWHLGAVAED
jgi:uncharacterized damage-inducible protein DinB